MDISVKKLSEILKIDPEVLLSKMIDAGLSHKSVDDLVSTEDKQKLLSYIRSSKDAPAKPLLLKLQFLGQFHHLKMPSHQAPSVF